MRRSDRDHRRYRQSNEPIEDPDFRPNLIPADEGHRLQRYKGYLQNENGRAQSAVWPACCPQVDQGDRGHDDRGPNKKQPAAREEAFANETTLAPFDGTDSNTLTMKCMLDKDNPEHE
jgi:hypothetical protein